MSRDLTGLLLDIRSQATRYKRATHLKSYLLDDLDAIEKLAARALALLDDLDAIEKLAARALALMPDAKDLPDDAQLLYVDTITIVHDRLQSPDAAVRDVIEFLIGLGSVPSVTGCKHETVIEFEIPCSSTWEAFERGHEVDTTVSAYGVYSGVSEDKIVTRPWRNTCAEAMRRMERS